MESLRSSSSRPAVARFEPLLTERGGLASSRYAGLAELAPCGRSVRTPFNGEGGIRTPKPVRAPVFETGALPFCHLSGCRLPGCWRKLRRPVRAAGEGAPRGLPLSNFRDGRGGIGFLPLRGTRRARSLRSLGWVATLPELAPCGRSVRTHEGRHLRPASWETAITDGVGLASSRYAGLAELAPCGRSVRTHEGRHLRPASWETAITDGVGFEPTRQGCCPHALQACALVRSATRPEASGVRPEVERRRGWDWLPTVAELATRGRSVRTHETLSSRPHRPSEAEGVGFEPTRLFRVNALAGRRLKPLGHPSAGSCCPDWPARTRTWNLLVQSQTCCQFHHGPPSQWVGPSIILEGGRRFKLVPGRGSFAELAEALYFVGRLSDRRETVSGARGVAVSQRNDVPAVRAIVGPIHVVAALEPESIEFRPEAERPHDHTGVEAGFRHDPCAEPESMDPFSIRASRDFRMNGPSGSQ